MKRIRAAVLAAALLAGIAVTAVPAQAVSHCIGSGGARYICEYGVTVHRLPDGTKQEFLVGTDSAVWTRWNDKAGKWTGWQSMGGIVSGRVLVIDRWSQGDPWRFALSVPTPGGWQFVNIRSLDILPLLKEGDSYGSRRGVFCFVADCPPGELR